MTWDPLIATMKYRTFGETAVRVSEIGFGGWALGGQWGDQSDEESTRALHESIDRGINFIDTAASYGDGRSERVVASVVRERKEEVFVATKTPPADGPWPPSPYCRWQDRYSAAHLRENVEQRLRNLRRDSIDLLQLHSWTRRWNDDPQPLLVLQKLREEGKIRYIGICTPEQDQNSVIQPMRDGLVDCVQVVFNLFEQEPAAQLLPVAQQTRTAVIVRVPLDEGVLTGKYAADHNFPESDFRHIYFAGDRLPRAKRRQEAIWHDVTQAGLAEQFTPADVAIKFALAQPAVSTVVTGIRNVEQAARNAACSELPDLSEPLLHRLRRHNWRRGVWYGTK